MPFFGSKLDGTAQFSLLDSFHEVAGLENEHLDPLEFLFEGHLRYHVQKRKHS